VTLRLSREKLLSRTPITLRLPTPCGLTEPVPVAFEGLDEAAESKKREDEPTAALNVTARLSGTPNWPKRSTFWVDSGKSFEHKLKVGQADLAVSSYTQRSLGVAVYGLDCAPQHDLTVDGKKVAVLERPPPNGSAEALYFVTADAGACYELRWLEYVKPGAPAGALPAPRSLRGASFYPLPDRPTYVIDLAPPRAQGDGTVIEIGRVDCASKAP
jgi:hypothetical protein